MAALGTKTGWEAVDVAAMGAATVELSSRRRQERDERNGHHAGKAFVSPGEDVRNHDQHQISSTHCGTGHWPAPHGFAHHIR